MFEINHSFPENMNKTHIFSIQHDDHDGDSLDKFSKMINNVYKNEIAPAKLARSLCLPGTYCVSLYKDRNFYRAQIISSDLIEGTSTIRYIGIRVYN